MKRYNGGDNFLSDIIKKSGAHLRSLVICYKEASLAHQVTPLLEAIERPELLTKLTIVSELTNLEGINVIRKMRTL